MDLTIYSSYDEANKELGLPRGTGNCGDLVPIPALDQDTHSEQYSCVVYVRKWTYTYGDDAPPPDLSFIGLECVNRLSDGYKTDIFVYARMDGCDSHN